MIRSELEMPDRLKTDTDSLRPNYAKYTAEPFERGFGTTLGNSLRRVLLSSIKGAAITAVQIEQVKHEYATIPGVVEDVVQIILNLKEIRLNIATDDPTKLTLKAEGSGEVTAADIRSNALIEIINPDQHIATLDECEALDIEIHAQTGRGYSLAEEHRPIDHEIGLIPVDAKFSPVEKVNFWVEETRVGDMTNFDKLNLEVWTDATITAKEAVTRAANILLQQLEIFTEFDETYVEPEPEIDEAKLRRDRYLAKPVSELELSVRASNCLETANIKTIRELVTKEEKDMLEYKNFGRTSLNEIKEQLANMGLALGMKLDDLDDADIDEENMIQAPLQPPV
ncbi:DNA-directed RNA polymerase subunit alpha [Candidatus Poribacteria bacterium]|nr:DNA-directed RNA polymerase subunit alpha [Candidatus Poribacteria bacterium]MDE0687987.1 DNA-directed RNA polymerase subunit alpha [Candidatus Poribacteria bacterium]MXV84892.1 DNA-directed RNA polymerase subunit alpha [Candidatus Poribacteria bacterium]MYA54685.1 DNA-directed RNA polymerase subunit alpha [Candidatus Poribacteria bacterium]